MQRISFTWRRNALELWILHMTIKQSYLGVVCRREAVQVPRYLGPQVRDHDEFLQNVLGEDVRVARLLDVVGGDVDVVGAQVKIGRRNGSHLQGIAILVK